MNAIEGHHANGASDDDLAPYRAMSREDLELHAYAVEGRLRAVVETVQHWRQSEERTAEKGYIAPFRYSLAELAVTIRNAIFWANWPATEHVDIFAETAALGPSLPVDDVKAAGQ